MRHWFDESWVLTHCNTRAHKARTSEILSPTRPHLKDMPKPFMPSGLKPRDFRTSKNAFRLPPRRVTPRSAWADIAQQPRPTRGCRVMILYDITIPRHLRIRYRGRRKRKAWFQGRVTGTSQGPSPVPLTILTVDFTADTHYGQAFQAEAGVEVVDNPTTVKIVRRR